jgi:hypothetical protein
MKKKNLVKINELVPIFMEEPFSIENNEDALLLARYLIEDNDEAYVELNMKRSNKLITVRSILKQVVGQYKIMNYDEEKKIREEISTVFCFKKIRF